MKNRELRMKLLALGMAGAMTISLCGCGTETTEERNRRPPPDQFLQLRTDRLTIHCTIGKYAIRIDHKAKLIFL